jgi:hypothetical protein
VTALLVTSNAAGARSSEVSVLVGVTAKRYARGFGRSHGGTVGSAVMAAAGAAITVSEGGGDQHECARRESGDARVISSPG